MVGVHWAALRDRQTQTISGYYDDSTASFDPESFRIMGAYRLFPKKKVSIQAGVFVDAASAGLHLGSSF
ncbi:MAG: hypothetical protein E4H01_10950 [Lysobacterales bacterium]|nr:MAG: hypothetical protein E4H01_10950 [Xanthomonadales bacterium]